MALPILVDLSRYDGDVDFHALRAYGVEGVILRTTVGNYYVDYRMREYYAGATAAGLLRQPYTVVRPTSSAQQHFDKYMEATQGLVWDLPADVDCECEDGQAPAVITEVIEGYCALLQPLWQLPLFIYTRQEWWDRCVLIRPLWHTLHLHAARYSDTLISPWSDGHCKFRDWNEWTYWQFTESGHIPGIPQAACDLNRANMTREELYAMANRTPPTVPPATQFYTIGSKNVRSLPDTDDGSNVIGKTLSMQPWELTGKEMLDDEGRNWVQVQGYVAEWLGHKV